MISRDSVSDQVFHILMEKITNGEFAVNQRLPGEAELAKEYGVSRMTVHAAIQKLKALGMVDTVAGGGTFVKPFNFSEVIWSLSGPMSQRIAIEDVKEFRVTIESKVLAMACTRRQTAEDVEYLQECYRQMEQAVEAGDGDAMTDADYRFHFKICAMSGNAMFAFAYEMLGSVIAGYINRLNDTASGIFRDSHRGMTYDELLEIHRKIIMAIRTGNPEEVMAMYSRYGNK